MTKNYSSHMYYTTNRKREGLLHLFLNHKKFKNPLSYMQIVERWIFITYIYDFLHKKS